jgi:glutamate 5-kinase
MVELNNFDRIVVKIGSSLLIDPAFGELKKNWLASLLEDVAELHAAGKELVLVSSGSIGLGRKSLRLASGTLKLEASQAAAAVGQIKLAHAYAELLQQHKLVAAQILLTLDDTEQRKRYLNARSTINTLLKLGAVPVVNENDTVATNEIRYGDNDRLAARVASMITADCLVILSDVDGLYTTAPDVAGAEHIARVEKITAAVEKMAGETGSDYGKGGMITKIEAAKIATRAGTHMAITSGQHFSPLKQLADGGKCTWFLPHDNPVTARKRWIAGTLVPHGALHIDDGAAKALKAGNSLLPAGVLAVSGEFERGDAVRICTHDGSELGHGLVGYNNHDVMRVIGRDSREIAHILGYSGRSELIHRDDMVLTSPA